jgi:hypothetical protein
MTVSEIQAMLDRFDAQLAEGRIDMPTYRELTEKWKARLAGAEPDGGASPSAAPAAAPPAPEVDGAYETVKISCPQCGAPADGAPAQNQTDFTCVYCGHSYRLESRKEKIQQELQNWISQYVSDQVRSTTVDQASRGMIFREKLLPSLERELDRVTEAVGGYAEDPLFSLPAAKLLGNGAPASPIGSDDRLLEPAKALSNRVRSPAVQEFAVSTSDKSRLAAVERNVSQILFTSNLLRQSSRPPDEGYSGALNSLKALEEAHRQASGEGSIEAREFHNACVQRLAAAAGVLDAVKDLYGGGDVAGSALSGRLQLIAKNYQEALDRAQRSNHSPLELIPWQRGAERELALAQLQAGLLTAYEIAAANRRASYAEFEQSVGGFASAAALRLTQPRDLQWIVAQLANLVEARRGSRGLPRVADWSWTSDALEQHRKKATLGFLGVNEEASIETYYWRPFWVGGLSYAVEKGAFLRKGSEAQAFALLDAVAPSSSHVTVLDGPMADQIQAALRREVVDNRLTLPLLAGREQAQKALGGFTQSKPELAHARVKLEAIVYLPAVVAQYRSKEGLRRQELAPLAAYANDTTNLRLGTAKFVEHYAG